MATATLPTTDVEHRPTLRADRVFITAYGFESSFELYRSIAARLGLSFSDYTAVVLARFHGLDDPVWAHVGELDLSKIGVQPLLEDPSSRKPKDMRARVSPDERAFYDDRAHEHGVSQRVYLGYIMALIHGEPPIVNLGSDREDNVLRFSPAARQVEPGVYEARVP